ncbi:MAG: hypothetical protein LC541_01345 [Candidatus Thiodiazotropha sp.]|nr:hypothetical protein [Candidatus Thiodiazotropha sp.]MCM8881967.1 hypothetical protein [Candidatus Thiodiazotropha sp.]MCM8918955.1 hypothetical protein [Candidatus Thiodiazotropha sp.]
MTGRRVRMLALHPLWRKARRVYSLASRLPGTNRLGFQPSLALSECLTVPVDHLDSICVTR